MEKDLSALKLKLLEDGGVDNWEGYDESLGRFHEYEDYVNNLSDDKRVLSYEDWLNIPNAKYYEMVAPIQMEIFDGSSYMMSKYDIIGGKISLTPSGLDVDEDTSFIDSSYHRMTIEEGDVITTDKRGKHYLIRKEDFLNNYKEVEG